MGGPIVSLLVMVLTVLTPLHVQGHYLVLAPYA
jgi:hypothetical protein